MPLPSRIPHPPLRPGLSPSPPVRAYWGKQGILDESWQPPAVTRKG